MSDFLGTLYSFAVLLIAGLVFIGGLARIADSHLSEIEKDALKKNLSSFPSPETVVGFVSSFLNTFDAIFGRKHLTLRCLLISVVATIFLMICIFAFTYLISSQGVRKDFIEIIGASMTHPVIFALFVLANILVDYVSLLETRLVIGAIKSTSGQKSVDILLFSIALVLDLLLTTIIFIVLFSALSTLFFVIYFKVRYGVPSVIVSSDNYAEYVLEYLYSLMSAYSYLVGQFISEAWTTIVEVFRRGLTWYGFIRSDKHSFGPFDVPLSTFYATTYMTSISLLLFIMASTLVQVLKKSKNMMKTIIGDMNRPVFVISRVLMACWFVICTIFLGVRAVGIVI